MKTSDFDYLLPQELIAQTPLFPRDASRMLVCNRNSHARRDDHFRNFPDYLRAGDALVLNRSRVIPARLLGEKRGTKVPCEVLLLKRLDQWRWEALVKPGRRLPQGSQVVFGQEELCCQIENSTDFGGRIVRFSYDGVFEEILDHLGEMPLPPYIHEQLADQHRYQTVYAKELGSAAAPTAGLHFTPEVLQSIRDKGVQVVELLLHVGLGTFRPVKVSDVSDHKMHAEQFELSQQASDTINDCKSRGGRVVCVGTTSVRTLETLANDQGRVLPGRGMTDIFIKPGYQFKVVDALLTNFHLPQSTLLMLVSALMGRDNALSAYREAVQARYRFFSFGDCMLIGNELIKEGC